MSNTPPVITVPDTPPADPDYNSFLQEVLAGTLPINELNFRLNAKDGVARADDGRTVVRGRNDRFVFAQNQSDGLRETRVLNEEQRAVVKEVAER
ncbi:MAG: hypothetical protein QG623_216, partial [Patescibacteria group bacterium]|nr:hypothetical protein [Patescibacteria group bacterium]